MITRLLTIWYAVRSSLWALPLTMVVVACALAFVALNVDLPIGGGSVWFLFSGSAEQAPEFLSSLVTAMITMATLAVSITMVVLTLAAQQLGPRLIGNFMSDRRTQITLGLFIATVVYLLLVLRGAYGQGKSVPNLAVTGGTLLVLICLATLLLFVHHLAHAIVADNVIDRVGAQLDADIARLLPEESEEQPEAPADLSKRGASVHIDRGGYVQAVDFQSIVSAAAAVDATVQLEIRAGQLTVPSDLVAHVAPERAATDELCRAITNAVVVGRERTAVQDLEFSIRQLVEVALRALSPGINDPYTAIAVLDRLTLSLSRVMRRGPAKSVWTDGDDTVRLIAPVSTFDGITDAAFNQIRQQALPSVLMRMAECIGQLLHQAKPADRPALKKHLQLVLRAAHRSFKEKEDLKELDARTNAATKDDS